MIQLMRTIAAMWVLGVQAALERPLDSFVRVFRGGALLVLLAWGARLIEGGRPALGDHGYFVYAVVGWGAFHLWHVALVSAGRATRALQETGAIEQCLLTRTPPWQVLVSVPVFAITRAALVVALVMVVALGASGLTPGAAALASIALHLGLLVACAVAVGMVSSAVVLVLRAEDPLARLLSVVSLVCCGAFVPRDLLPAGAAAVGGYVPLGPALDGIRLALAGSQGAAQATTGVLIASLVGLGIAGAAVLALAFRVAQRDGALAGPQAQ